MDRQGSAFRDSTPGDWMTSPVEVEYRDGDPTPIMTPEDWVSAGWDSGRDSPKTLEQARRALAARIADPLAPDSRDHAHAYDHLEP